MEPNSAKRAMPAEPPRLCKFHSSGVNIPPTATLCKKHVAALSRAQSLDVSASSSNAESLVLSPAFQAHKVAQQRRAIAAGAVKSPRVCALHSKLSVSGVTPPPAKFLHHHPPTPKWPHRQAMIGGPAIHSREKQPLRIAAQKSRYPFLCKAHSVELSSHSFNLSDCGSDSKQQSDIDADEGKVQESGLKSILKRRNTSQPGSLLDNSKCHSLLQRAIADLDEEGAEYSVDSESDCAMDTSSSASRKTVSWGRVETFEYTSDFDYEDDGESGGWGAWFNFGDEDDEDVEEDEEEMEDGTLELPSFGNFLSAAASIKNRFLLSVF